jgi:hypothetical protein
MSAFGRTSRTKCLTNEEFKGCTGNAKIEITPDTETLSTQEMSNIQCMTNFLVEDRVICEPNPQQ